MIYNFLNWLQQQKPHLNFVVEGSLVGDAQERIDVYTSGGATRAYPDNRNDTVVQLTVRRHDQFECNKISEELFELCRERYNVEMPPHPLDDTGATTINVARLYATSRPIPEFRDSEGVFIYRINLVLTYSG